MITCQTSNVIYLLKCPCSSRQNHLKLESLNMALTSALITLITLITVKFAHFLQAAHNVSSFCYCGYFFFDRYKFVQCNTKVWF